MKKYPFSITILVYFIFINNCICQCDLKEFEYIGYVEFTSQQQFDGFMQRYSNCDSIKFDLILSGYQSQDPIRNLIACNDFKYVKGVYIIEAPLSNLNGIGRIKKIDTLGLRISNLENLLSLDSIDTIGSLSFEFNNNIRDLKQFARFNIINSLELVGSGDLIGFKVERPNFALHIFENHNQNDFTHILGNVPANLTLSIIGASNFSFDGLEQLQFLQDLVINGCSEISLKGVQGIKEIGNLVIGDSDFKESFHDYNFNSLVNVNGQLNFYKLDQLYKLSDLLPNIKNVGFGVSLFRNDNLHNLFILEGMNLPQEEFNLEHDIRFFDEPNFRLSVWNNPALENCSIEYFCTIINHYPDEVRIENNGVEGCNLNQLKGWCQTVSFEEINTADMIIYPNPTDSYIYLYGNRNYDIDLYSMNGDKVLDKDNVQVIDLSLFSSGQYLMRVAINGMVYWRRINKI